MTSNQKTEPATSRFVVVEGGTSLAATGLKHGQITKHPTKPICFFKCPFCHSVQFHVSEVIGPDDAPTVKQPFVCGSGTCMKCAMSFRIRAGKLTDVKNPEQRKAEETIVPTSAKRSDVSERLAKRIKRPPQITKDILEEKRRQAAEMNK